MKRRIIAWFPLVVWLVNVLAVVLSYFLSMMWAWAFLVLAVFVVWPPTVVRVRKWTREGEPLFRKKPPAWVIGAAAVSVAYTFVNFIVCLTQLREGGPMLVDGVYCLWNHGFIREISFEEYTRLQLIEGRLFVGHLLTFTGLPMLFLWPEAEKPNQDGTERGVDG